MLDLEHALRIISPCSVERLCDASLTGLSLAEHCKLLHDILFSFITLSFCICTLWAYTVFFIFEFTAKYITEAKKLSLSYISFDL